MLLEITNNDDDLRREQIPINEFSVDNQPSDLAKISFHAILRKSTPTTMKLKRLLSTKEALILVDSGLTHNFMANPIVDELNLLVQFVPPFDVQISN